MCDVGVCGKEKKSFSFRKPNGHANSSHGKASRVESVQKSECIWFISSIEWFRGEGWVISCYVSLLSILNLKSLATRLETLHKALDLHCQ